MPLSSFVYKTKNKKLGDISSTYASTLSCPRTCNLKKAGCYARIGNVGIHSRRYDRHATHHKATSYQVTQEEVGLIAAAIKRLDIRGRMLRLHVSGDVTSVRAAKLLSNAAKKWKENGGGNVFSYTHAWKTIARDCFNHISILASCSSLSEANQAIKRNYAPTIIVRSFPNGDKTFRLGKLKFIPCPSQTKNVTCEKCRLCTDSNRLHKNKMGIAFMAHGQQKNKIKTTI